jgi:hypothetical protein
MPKGVEHRINSDLVHVGTRMEVICSVMPKRVEHAYAGVALLLNDRRGEVRLRVPQDLDDRLSIVGRKARVARILVLSR